METIHWYMSFIWGYLCYNNLGRLYNNQQPYGRNQQKSKTWSIFVMEIKKEAQR